MFRCPETAYFTSRRSLFLGRACLLLRVLSGGGVLSKTRQYRQYARECLEMAGEATELSVRAVLIHMAAVWQRLADQHVESDSYVQLDC